MPKGKTKYTKELLEEVVVKSRSYREVHERLGIKYHNGKSRYIRDKIKQYNISISHFIKSPSRDKTAENCKSVKKVTQCIRWPDEVVFCKNSVLTRGPEIRRRLLKKGWEFKCNECGLEDEWNGKPITLQLDHINGDSCDNRYENLRFLCPNCHSQTETFGNKKHYNRKVKSYCKICNKLVSYGFDRCQSCAAKETGKKLLGKFTKIDWPSTEELIEMTSKEPFTTIAKRLGVSDNAIRKRIKNHPVKE
jgi:hypothetical protein